LRVAVVLPCYKSRESVLDVIAGIGPEVARIIAVDDACPQKTGEFIQSNCSDERLLVLFHDRNAGVGGAVITGYEAALSDRCDIVVKVDSDGQMDPQLVPALIQPIRAGLADYVKGNRFFSPEDAKQMPFKRLIGNLGLSFLTKLSAGYWDIFDPTNGFTAIHRAALTSLPLGKISRRYFFETDMLFRLNIAGAVVTDMPMVARYAGEHSSLSPLKSLVEFSGRHLATFAKRVGYKYFLRDFSLGSINLLLAVPMLLFGVSYGVINWIDSLMSGVPATAGTVMVAALPSIFGVQLLLGFWAQDYNSVPRIPLQKLLPEELPCAPIPRISGPVNIRNTMKTPTTEPDSQAGS